MDPRGLSPQVLAEVAGGDQARLSTGCGELDRVLGGGLVPGSVVLLGGEPGIGKSTLLLQAGHALATDQRAVLYVSGEESPDQLKRRADRLELGDSSLTVVAATELELVEELVERCRPAVVVVDSIQALRAADVEAQAGSLGQVRECTGRLTELAKRSGVAMLLIGHVTKEGHLAGPKVTEHIVDAVLMFEGERTQALKVLRATKNRFGATHEVGLFEMRDSGLVGVPDAASVWLAERDEAVSGTAALCTIEGSRPLVLEVQALVAPSPFASPRRVASGLDLGRLHVLLAVLEQRGGIRLGQRDVYLNVAGGVRVCEPAADLAVVMAAASAATGTPLPAGTIMFGEVGLTGEVRRVAHTGLRLAEAGRLGFVRALLPRSARAGDGAGQGLELAPVRTVREALSELSRVAAMGVGGSE